MFDDKSVKVYTKDIFLCYTIFDLVRAQGA